MEKLLPYYERELGMLRRASHEFAARYPRLAGNLQMSGETRCACCASPRQPSASPPAKARTGA